MTIAILILAQVVAWLLGTMAGWTLAGWWQMKRRKKDRAGKRNGLA